MSAPEVPFSELQLHTTATMEKLRASRSHSLRLRRRADEDLMLTTASRAEQDGAVLSATTKMFAALIQHDDAARRLLADVLPEAFPWVQFLPREDVQAFVLDLVSTLRAAESLDNPAPVVHLMDAWRHTAEAYADPALAAVLAATSGDDEGLVPEPSAAT